ncbi:MAG: hypothetical protein MUE73_11780 [Planctomycetes bacterium]|jgi:hypothetical protein|nr:hypothetical protein [Planctomycetota bacterium]
MAESLGTGSILEGLRRDRVHSTDIAKALAEFRTRFAMEGILSAVIDALAMRQHGCARHTEDIDIVTTPDGLQSIHERLVGRGSVPRPSGLRKKLRDTKHRVDLDMLRS